MIIDTSKALFKRAGKYIPGGVNSPPRAFKSVGADPVFIKSAKGAYLQDEDGNEYVDLFNSWGPMILGHANIAVEEAVQEAVQNSLSFGTPTRNEVDIAELITKMVPSVEKVRMVNSGTEATMSAIRVARGYTGKDKVLKFEGCYHGHGDSFLIAAGSGAATMGTPNSPGVTEGTAKDTLTARFNDLEHVKEVVETNKGEIAALIVEPVPGNMGCVPPEEGFLKGLRDLCDKEGIVLIFDEVMTGFRLARGGAQELFKVTPDLTTMGKVIGGGMPVGAFGGKADLMDMVSPDGPVYQGGTLSGNPVAMAAGYTVLKHLNDNPDVYRKIERTTENLVAGINRQLGDLDLDFQVNQLGSMMTLFFTGQEVKDFSSAKTSNTELFGMFFRNMLQEGVHLPPSQFESWFVSTAIKDDVTENILEATEKSLEALTQKI